MIEEKSLGDKLCEDKRGWKHKTQRKEVRRIGNKTDERRREDRSNEDKIGGIGDTGVRTRVGKTGVMRI